MKPDPIFVSLPLRDRESVAEALGNRCERQHSRSSKSSPQKRSIWPEGDLKRLVSRKTCLPLRPNLDEATR